jgi:hydrogenase maturation protease
MNPSELPPAVEVLDGGTSGADLIDEVADRPKLVVIDAVNTDQPPGTVMRFGLADLQRKAESSISLHEFGLLETLEATRHLGCAPAEIVIIGVQPRDVSPGLELSDEIAALLPKLAALALREAERSSSDSRHS